MREPVWSASRHASGDDGKSSPWKAEIKARKEPWLAAPHVLPHPLVTHIRLEINTCAALLLWLFWRIPGSV